MSWITTAVVVFGVSGAASAAGQYQQSRAQASMYQFEANSAEMQKQLIKRTSDANITAQQGEASRLSAMEQRRAMAVKGEQEAQVGGQGLGSSVTAADIAKDTFTKQQMDQMVLQYNANIKSWDITNRMNNDIWSQQVRENQALAAKRNAIKAGNTQVATTLLSTAASMATLGATAGTTTSPSFGSTNWLMQSIKL